MPPRPVGPPPGRFDDEPGRSRRDSGADLTPDYQPPKEGPDWSLLVVIGVIGVSVLLGIRSCSIDAPRRRPRGGSP
ncbi:MAG: hypothetical protein ACYTKD_12940 [Planctomycetota bacterium]|jgi:hypothetical protein